MLSWRFQRRDEPLPGARLLQHFLQSLLPRELVEQILIFECSLKQRAPLGFRKRPGSITAEQLPGFVSVDWAAHLPSQSGPSRWRSSLRQRKSQVYKVLIELTFICF